MTATIVSSTIITDSEQKDTRRVIREKHVDSLAAVYYFDYICLLTDTPSNNLAGHAAQILTQQAAAEIAGNVANALANAVFTPQFNYSTQAQNIAAFRAFYLTATAWDACRMGNYIQGLGLTDTSLETLFGVSAGAQLTALKANLAAAAASYVAAIAQVGQ